jgi:hypothetical protein
LDVTWHRDFSAWKRSKNDARRIGLMKFVTSDEAEHVGGIKLLENELRLQGFVDHLQAYRFVEIYWLNDSIGIVTFDLVREVWELLLIRLCNDLDAEFVLLLLDAIKNLYHWVKQGGLRNLHWREKFGACLIQDFDLDDRTLRL